MPDMDAEAREILAALDQLFQNPPQAASLPSWLLAWNGTKLDTQTLWARSLVATYKNANDSVAQAAYQHFMKAWLPQLDGRGAEFAALALDAGLADSFPGIAVRLKLELNEYRSSTTTEQGQYEWELTAQFNKIQTNLLIEHDGEKIPLSEAYSTLGNISGREQRSVLWEKIKMAEVAVYPQLDRIYEKLVQLRMKIASRAGNKNYAEYAWDEALREYCIEDAVLMFDNIHEVFSVLNKRLDYEQATQLGVGQLRPWDNVNSNREEQHYGLGMHDYISTAEQILDSLDISFGNVLRDLKHHNALDLTPRLGKSYVNTAVHYLSIGRSEILCTTTGGIEGFKSFLHELGHAIHCHSVSQNPINTFWDFVGFKEVEEFYAYVFTFLGSLKLLEQPDINSDQRRQELRRLGEHALHKLRNVEERLRTELWIYQQQEPMPASEIDAAYLRLSQDTEVDWSGFENIRAKQWQTRQTYLSSFYNIDYAVAVIAAVLFVHSYTTSPDVAIQRLKSALRLGATQGVSTILETAGVSFPFCKEQLITARTVIADWLG